MVSEPAQQPSRQSSQRGIDFLLEEVAERRLNGNAQESRSAALERQHGRGKLSARERLDILFDAGSFTEIDPFVKHRGTGFGAQPTRGRRRGRWPRHRRRSHRVCLRPGLHPLWRLGLRGRGREDRQDPGPLDESRRADRCNQRRWRRSHPGGRHVAARLRRDFPAQHALLGTSSSWFRAPDRCTSPAPT